MCTLPKRQATILSVNCEPVVVLAAFVCWFQCAAEYGAAALR